MNKSRLKWVIPALACAGLIALAGCNWLKLDDDDPPSDFAQKALEKHYQNGDMNDYQYQQSEKQFTPADPSAQKPAGSSDTSTPNATTAKP
jgi:hypothetical protein